jgi:hypothetical protein
MHGQANRAYLQPREDHSAISVNACTKSRGCLRPPSVASLPGPPSESTARQDHDESRSAGQDSGDRARPTVVADSLT